MCCLFLRRRNETCFECAACLDKYWTLKQLKSECAAQRQALQGQVHGLRAQMEAMAATATGELEVSVGAVRACDEQRSALERGWRRCRADKEAVVCGAHADKMQRLQHDLGECNVEWGACQQIARQKDAVDARRVREIEKLQKQFSLCNAQLKRYKDAAKKRRLNP